MDLDAALAKIASLEGTISTLKTRISTLSEQKNTFKATADEATAELGELKKQLSGFEKAGKAHESVAAELEAYKAKESAWNTERALMTAGVTDPEGIDFVQLAYNRVPEDKRPKDGITAWLADRDNLPKALTPYLPPAEDKGDGDGQGKQQTQQRRMPNTGRGVERPQGNTGTLTPAQIASSSSADWAAQREQTYRDLGVEPPSLPTKR